MKISRFLLLSLSLALGAQIAFGLTVKPNVSPVVTNQIGDQQVYFQTTDIIDLAGFFSDPDASAAAQLVTPQGTMNFTLDGATTPITVANFLNYVNTGRYFETDPTNGQLASTFFHRSVANFVIQGGGFLGTVNPNTPANAQPVAVLTYPAIQNEPNISNRRGTIAMAKLSGDPNSATSQWFINLADNSGGTPALDTQNGGFTVFGRVAGTGMTVADAIAALPAYNFGAPFDALPLENYSQSDFNSNKAVKVPNLVSISQITQISPLTFTASSDNTAVATTLISGTQLLLRTSQLGSANITVTATDLDGATVSQTFNLTVVTAPGRPLNISTRVNFPNGNEVLIGGFLINGTTSKRLIVRALGPSLQSPQIPNVISDPVLALVDSSNNVIASNDNWVDSPDAQFLSDFGLAPNNNKESALVATVSSTGDYTGFTAQVRSGNGQPGVGLVEVYDLDSGPGSTLLNLSTRGQVDPSPNVLIGGFLLRGSDSRRLLVRALGPSLSNKGVTGALADPTLEVRDGQGNLLDSNDDWQTRSDTAEIESYHLAPDDPKESVVLVTLPAGDYTAVITGTGPQPTGVALVEVYKVQ